MIVDTTVPSQQIQELAGEAITIGTPIYQTNATNGYWFLANSSNAFMAGSVNGVRMALSQAAAAGQPIMTLRTGRVALGATADVGELICLSVNAGKLRPIGDMILNEFTTVVGYMLNATHMTMPASGAIVVGVARNSNVT